MFLGVDGGGTKTAYCLIAREGRVLACVEQASCYYLSIGLEAAERALIDGVAHVCREAGIEAAAIEHAFFGLPAFGEIPDALDRLRAMPGAALGHDRYHVDNDMVCGWAGSLGAIDGINVIAGTGSMTYGERAGQRVRCGGWGALFGDEGSAYWIGIAGLNAFSRMSDGRLEPGPLYARFKHHLDLDDDLALVDVVLNHWSGDRSQIAALAPIVLESALAGDIEATAITDSAANALVDLVETTARRLGFEPGQRVPVSYTGGLFRAPIFTDRFQRRMARCERNVDLRQPLHTPVVGAALYAARLAGGAIKMGREPSGREDQAESRPSGLRAGSHDR